MELGTSEEIKAQLLRSSEDFRKLANEHSGYDEQLERLVHKTYLTEEEQIQETRLKKMKLHVKDQMELMIQQYRNQASKQPVSSK
ncbi:MAG: YdcH family protein [Acidobacteriota bacterium]